DTRIVDPSAWIQRSGSTQSRSASEARSSDLTCSRACAGEWWIASPRSGILLASSNCELQSPAMAGFPTAIPGKRRSARRALPFAVLTRSHSMATQSRRSRSIFVFVIAVALAAVTPLWAQSTATLQGSVTDAQGAIVPGATVVAVNEDTGVQRSTLTDSAGS